MSVLIEGFTLVLRRDAIEASYRGGWPAFLDEMVDQTFACDERLARLGCRDRHELRARLAKLAEQGLPDAADLLRTTEVSPRSLTAEEIAELEAIQAGTTAVALVYRRQARKVPWLELAVGPLPAGGKDVAGCWLAGEEPGGLAVPEDWRAEQVLSLREEPEAGDERLHTWHEYLADLPAHNRDWMMQTGPEGVLSLMRGLGFPKPFAGQIRPSPNVIEQERVVRDPDGAEHIVTERWTRLKG